MNTKGFEFSFGWIFALIVGAVIIFLAVYGVMKLGSNERSVQDSEIARQLGNLLTPMEISIEEAKTAPLSFTINSRIYLGCRMPTKENPFGAQILGVSTESGIGKKWDSLGVNYSVYNKYIFGSPMAEGKKFIILSKPFEFPFKIADIMILLKQEEDYCFVDAPREVEEELSGLGLNKTIQFADDRKDCVKKIKVCFAGTGCDVDVFADSKSVRKNRKVIYYQGSLIYGAIFSEPSLYECQVSRIMGRASELANLYLEKSAFLGSRGSGCSLAMQPFLEDYKRQTLINDSAKLYDLSRTAEDLREVNADAASCRLF
jgi:hypothetical protein